MSTANTYDYRNEREPHGLIVTTVITVITVTTFITVITVTTVIAA